MEPERVCTMIAACTVLHNIYIARRMPLPRNRQQNEEEDVPDDDPADQDNVSGRLVRARIVASL